MRENITRLDRAYLRVVPPSPQALDEIGDVNVTVQDSASRQDGRAGRQWTVSFTALGYPAHVGAIQVMVQVS